MLTYLLMTLLILTAIFLIVLVLIQRGKGGGLAGAFGGMGGHSASAPRPATCSPKSLLESHFSGSCCAWLP